MAYWSFTAASVRDLGTRSNIELTVREAGVQALPLPLEVSPDTEPLNLPHAPEPHKEKAGRSDLRPPPDFTHFHGYPI